jgi:hypothetical protein
MSAATSDELMNALLARAVECPNTLTLGRLGRLVEQLGELLENRELEEVTLKELRTVVANEGLSAMPMSTAVALLETVAAVAHHEDVLGHLIVRHLELLLGDTPM